MTMFMAMNVGATAMVARYKGAGNQKKADEVLRQALLMTFVLGCVFAVIGFIATPWLIKFMGASEDHVLQAGVDYLRIQMIGLPGLALIGLLRLTIRRLILILRLRIRLLFLLLFLFAHRVFRVSRMDIGILHTCQLLLIHGKCGGGQIHVGRV